MLDKLKEGFMRRLKADYQWDIEGKIFYQPLHLTVNTPWPRFTAAVYFAIFRFGQRIELTADVKFWMMGERKHVGLIFIEDRYYAFDWDADDGMLYPCRSSENRDDPLSS